MSNRVLMISNTDGAMYKFRRSLVERLSELGFETTCVVSPSSPEGSYIERLKSVCAKVVAVNFFRQSSFSVFVTAFKILSLSGELRPRVMHVFGHEALLFAVLAVLFNANPQKYVTITGLGRFFGQKSGIRAGFARHLILLVYRISLPKLDAIIFLNSNDLITFSKFFPKSTDKFKLIHGEGSAFALSPTYEEPARDVFSCLFASRIMREKGIFELLDAFELLPSHFKLIVLGTVDAYVADEPKIRLLLSGEIPNVEYGGFQDNITPYLAECSCVVLPSKYMEGLPMILVEALSMGKLIATSNAPGCADTVIEGENGVLLQDVTAENIVAAVRAAQMLDKEAAHAVSTNLFRSKFSADVVVDQIVGLYGIPNA